MRRSATRMWLLVLGIASLLFATSTEALADPPPLPSPVTTEWAPAPTGAVTTDSAVAPTGAATQQWSTAPAASTQPGPTWTSGAALPPHDANGTTAAAIFSTAPGTISPETQTVTAPVTPKPKPTPAPCAISPREIMALVQSAYAFETTATVRITLALTRALTCDATAFVYWKLPNRALLTAPTLALAAGTLPAGRYACSVSVVVPAMLANVTTFFTLTVAEPPPSVRIQGGNQTIRSNASLSMVVAIKSGTIRQWSWSCCAISVAYCFPTTCSIATSSGGDGYVVGRLISNLAPNGVYRVTVLAKTADGQIATDVTSVTVLATPVNTVWLSASTNSAVYVNNTVFLLARANLIFSSFSWNVTAGKATLVPIAKWGNMVAILTPRSPGIIAVSVTATDPARVQGTSITYVTVVPLPYGTCDVSSDDMTIVGGYSSVTVTVTRWTGSAAANFRFGYFKRNGNKVTLSPDFGLNRNLTVTAPVLVPAGNVTFFAESTEGGAEMYCRANITVVADLAALISIRTADMNSAMYAGDVGGVMRSVMDLMTALQATSMSEPARIAAGTQVLTGISTALTIDPSFLTGTLKGQAVEALLDFYSLVNRSTRVRDLTLQSNIALAIAAILSTSNSSQEVDTTTHGDALAAMVDQLDANTLATSTKAAAKQAKKVLAQQLAISIASQLPLGDVTNITSGGVSITALKLPASQVGGGAPLNASNGMGSISVSTAALASALNISCDDVDLYDADVSVSATVHGVNPVPTATVLAGGVLNGAIVEFDVTASGANFSNLGVALTIGIVASPNATCVFFDATLNLWTTVGVTTIGYDIATAQLLCNTTHLSLFSGSVDSLAPTTTIYALPTTTNTPDGSLSTTAAPNTNAPSGGSNNSTLSTSTVASTSSTAAPTTTSPTTTIAADQPTSSDSGLGPMSPAAIGVVCTVIVVLLSIGIVSVVTIVKLTREKKIGRKTEEDNSTTSSDAKRASTYITKEDGCAATTDRDSSPPPPPATALNGTAAFAATV